MEHDVFLMFVVGAGLLAVGGVARGLLGTTTSRSVGGDGVRWPRDRIARRRVGARRGRGLRGGVPDGARFRIAESV